MGEEREPWRQQRRMYTVEGPMEENEVKNKIGHYKRPKKKNQNLEGV